MTSSVRGRWWLWAALLSGAAWLAIFGDKSPAGHTVPDVAQAVARHESVADRSRSTEKGGSTVPPAEQRLLAVLPRSDLIRLGTAKVDLFSARNWTPPPPPIASAPAAPPTAPPLPYAYAGKKREAGQWEIYLTRGEAVYIVRQGAVIDGMYAIEEVSPPTMTLRYQPLNQMQTLAIGE